jgi:hypothetical protein
LDQDSIISVHTLFQFSRRRVQQGYQYQLPLSWPIVRGWKFEFLFWEIKSRFLDSRFNAIGLYGKLGRSQRRMYAQYTNLSNSYIFKPIAFENIGTLKSQLIGCCTHRSYLLSGVICLQRLMNFVNKPSFLQHLAITKQRFNTVLLRESFMCDQDK